MQGSRSFGGLPPQDDTLVILDAPVILDVPVLLDTPVLLDVPVILSEAKNL